MGEVPDLISEVVRTLPTRCLEQAVERYSRTVQDDEVDCGSTGSLRVALNVVDEWKRVQDHIVDEMTSLSASPDGLVAACASVVTRVFDAVEARMHEEGYGVPRAQLCRMFTDATPDTPANLDDGDTPGFLPVTPIS